MIQTLPAYPYNYPRNLDCTWFITADDGGFIILRFVLFHLVTNLDYLTIGRGHQITTTTMVSRLTGGVAPNTISIIGVTVWMQLTTPNGRWWGFAIEVNADDNNG